MNTLKERFEKQFPEWRNKNAQALHVLAFFQQELLALAEEVSQRKRELYMPEEINDGLDMAIAHTTLVHNQAIEAAAALIRSRTNEL